MLQNKDAYQLPDVASDYAKRTELQPSEATILSMLLPILGTARMLDMGVGGGRTSLHFSKIVREYVGADYSSSMIDECRRRFAGCAESVSFQVCDARNMEMFATDSFDFILFSHNGIDSVGHEDRLKVLKEVQRVGKSGGYFAFSTHNLNWARGLFDWSRIISMNPKHIVKTAKRLVMRFFYNWNVSAKTIRNSPHAIFNDGAHRRKLEHYYIRPLEQIEQLKEGFSDVRVFSHGDGAEIKDLSHLKAVEDPWLYYLCKIN